MGFILNKRQTGGYLDFIVAQVAWFSVSERLERMGRGKLGSIILTLKRMPWPSKERLKVHTSWGRGRTLWVASFFSPGCFGCQKRLTAREMEEGGCNYYGMPAGKVEGERGGGGSIMGCDPGLRSRSIMGWLVDPGCLHSGYYGLSGRGGVESEIMG